MALVRQRTQLKNRINAAKYALAQPEVSDLFGTKRKSSPFPVWRRVADRGIVTPSRGDARWMTALDGLAPGCRP